MRRSLTKSLPLIRQLAGSFSFTSDDLIRCGGRLHNAALNYSTRHPIILPGKHHFATLLNRAVHTTFIHCGMNATLSVLRQVVWIPPGHRRVKSILGVCVTCPFDMTATGSLRDYHIT